MTTGESIEDRISAECSDVTRLILQTAWARDLSGLKPLLNEPGRVRCQDPVTKETPLHAVIRGCGPAPSTKFGGAAYMPAGEADDSGEEVAEEAAKDTFKLQEAAETLYELFTWGAIWNDVDDRGETPGCVARRLGRKELYDMCVEAGVRAELLFGVMGGYEELSSGEDEEMDVQAGWGEGEGEIMTVEEVSELVEEDAGEAPQLVSAEDGGEGHSNDNIDGARTEATRTEAEGGAAQTAGKNPDVNSKQYLASNLVFSSGKIVDSDLNGVMMAWEKPIMERSVRALLCPRCDPSQSPPPATGKRILNVGFGMGIIDSLFAATSPSRHHIIEAHPAVLARLAGAKGVDSFGSDWEAGGPSEGAFKVHAGRWQDVVPALLAAGEVYDVVYFDTFGEDYGRMQTFFTDFLPAMLDGNGRFSYFNGCGADRHICYDVYKRVAETNLASAGMDVEWIAIDVDVDGLGKEGEGEWEGVRRRYWTLDKYQLPICTWMG